MRQDVKLGIVISMAVVLTAGVYYVFRGDQDSPVELGSDQGGSPPSARHGSVSSSRHAAPKRSKQPATGRQRPDARTARRPGLPDRRTGKPDAGSARRPSPVRAGSGTTARGTTARGPTSRTAADFKHPRRESGEPHRAVSRTLDRSSRQAAGTSIPRKTAGATPTGSVGPGHPVQADRPVPLAARRSVPSSRTADRQGGGAKAAVDRHRVQPGDTFTSLAELYYGDAQLARFLADRNPQVSDRDHLRVGQVVDIPPRPSGAAAPPVSAKPGTSAGQRTYRVQPGDSFYKIARDVLRDASRWRELFELNKELVDGDPRRLQVGQVVVLPQS